MHESERYPDRPAPHAAEGKTVSLENLVFDFSSRDSITSRLSVDAMPKWVAMVREHLAQAESIVEIKDRLLYHSRHRARLRKALPGLEKDLRAEMADAIRRLDLLIGLDHEAVRLLIDLRMAHWWRDTDFVVGDHVLHHSTWYPVVRIHSDRLVVQESRGLNVEPWLRPLRYTVISGRRRGTHEIVDRVRAPRLSSRAVIARPDGRGRADA